MSSETGSRQPQPISLSEYARHRGCSLQAVGKAARSGRLRHSLVQTSRGLKVADLALADREWAENSQRPKPRAVEADINTPLDHLSVCSVQQSILLSVEHDGVWDTIVPLSAPTARALAAALFTEASKHDHAN